MRVSVHLGDDDDPEKYLKAVCFDGEVAEMEEDMDTSWEMVASDSPVVRHSGWHWREPCAISVRLGLDVTSFRTGSQDGGRGFCQSTEAGSRQYRDPTVP